MEWRKLTKMSEVALALEAGEQVQVCREIRTSGSPLIQWEDLRNDVPSIYKEVKYRARPRPRVLFGVEFYPLLSEPFPDTACYPNFGTMQIEGFCRPILEQHAEEPSDEDGLVFADCNGYDDAPSRVAFTNGLVVEDHKTAQRLIDGFRAYVQR